MFVLKNLIRLLQVQIKVQQYNKLIHMKLKHMEQNNI